ncbi:cystathionine gamma-synthase [Aspergillus bertholletiae]|uniref:Cystathionine gamma-synthase n=1 Tax=Aspergillus bertholletiae TaxID=1226010 RepID=A0A5N7AV79_9EURO|nr:cystathionine gamma-synthase [Aspergillus bertholletiae]
MPLPVPPPLGHAIPYSRHAVSVQLPTWVDMCGMAHGEDRVKRALRIGYPRSFIQGDVRDLVARCVKRYASMDQTCLLFPSLEHASACEAFVQSQKDNDGKSYDSCVVRAIDFSTDSSLDLGHVGKGYSTAQHIRLYATFFPAVDFPVALKFWRLTGTGISSRLAEDLLANTNLSVDTGGPNQALQIHGAGPWTQDIIRQRIASLLNRTSFPGYQGLEIGASDIFLFPTGMSAIYHCNKLLNQWRGGQSIVFGFPYELTLKLVETFGKSCKFYGFGTPDELEDLEAYLHTETENGRWIQAIWCECPSNPLLRTVDLDRIRQLADQYRIPVVVDETIGTFANVDVSPVADIVITSLTKTFSGYLDVMAGSIILNPASTFYAKFRKILSTYPNGLYEPDAVQLECNSRDFLPRAAKMNDTAMALVSNLYPHVSTPGSILTNIYYPCTCWSAENYRARMRPHTPEFKPGYGCLFTLEFTSVATATRFFDALDVHKGPSLGGNLTLAQPYVQTVFFREKEWAARYGLKESIIRISVGLEEVDDLLDAFGHALRVASNAE